MRLKLFPVLMLLAGVLAAAPVHAQKGPAEPSPSHLAAARDLLVAAGASTSIDRILPVIANDIRRVAVTRPELAKDLEEVIKGMEPEFERQKEQGYLIAARVYAAQMTEAELKDATAFFRTPSGKKYVAALPNITENLINDITNWSQLSGEYVMTRVRAELAKRGHSLQ